MSTPAEPTEVMDTTEAATEAPTEATDTTTAVATTPTDKSQSLTTPPPSAVEFEPPLACVRRILKNSLPSSTNVGKDASAAFARACGIFIIYLTACSNDFAREHKRQTITANDVLAAIKVSTVQV
jgi:histone H3/H4